MDTRSHTHPLVMTAAASVTALSLAGIGAIFGLVPVGGSAKPTAAPVEAQVVAPAAAAATPSPLATTSPAAAARAETPATLSLPAGSAVKIETPSPRPQRTEVAARPQPKPQRETVYVERPAAAPAATPAVAHAPAPVRVAYDEPPSIYAERGSRYDPPETVRPVQAPTCRDCGVVANIRELPKAAEASGAGAVVGGVVGGLVGRQMGGGRGRDAMTVLGAVGGAVAGHQIEKSQRSSSDYEVTVRFDDGTTQVFKQETAPNWRRGDRIRVDGGRIVAL